MYLNFTNIEVELDANNVVQTCPAALGPGFAAGTTDGPGFPGFQQGDKQVIICSSCIIFLFRTFVLSLLTPLDLFFFFFLQYGCIMYLLNSDCLLVGPFQISEKWRKLRDILKKPSQYQVDCQQPKPVLLDTGEMFNPYAWAVRSTKSSTMFKSSCQDLKMDL